MAEDMDILVGVKVDSTEAEIQSQINKIAKNAKVKTEVQLLADKTMQSDIEKAVGALKPPTVFVNVDCDIGALRRLRQKIADALSDENMPKLDLAQMITGGQNGTAGIQQQMSRVQRAMNNVSKKMRKMAEVSFNVSDRGALRSQLRNLGVDPKDVDTIVKQLEQGGFKIEKAQARFAQRLVGRGKNRRLSTRELLQSLTVSGQTSDGVDAVKTVSYNAAAGDYATSTALGMTLNEQGKAIESGTQAVKQQKEINKLVAQLDELQAQAFNRRQSIKGDTASTLRSAIGDIQASLADLSVNGEGDIGAIQADLKALETAIKDAKAAQKAVNELGDISVADKYQKSKSSMDTMSRQMHEQVGQLDADGLLAEAQKVKDAFAQMQAAFSDVGRYGDEATSADWDVYTKAVKDYQEAVTQATDAQKRFANQQKAMSKAETLHDSLIDANMTAEAGALKEAMEGVSTAAKTLQSSTDAKDLQDYASAMKTLTETTAQYEKTLKKTQQQQSLQYRLDKQLQTVTKIRNDWSKAMANPENVATLDRIVDSMQAAAHANNKIGFDKATRELQVFQAEMRATGQATETLGNRMKRFFKEFTQWFSISQLVMQAIQGVKKMASTVTEIDTAMTELKKVTNETTASYEQFSERSEKTAKDLKTTITDVIDATSGWSRLGYGLEQSEELGKWSTIYANVGDDIASVDEATSNLVSTLKGFGTEGNTVVGQVQRIVDMFNKVGNATSISSGKIGESLQNSAAALSEANNSLSQSVALTVGAYDVLQSAGEVGNMWKTVSMRIRGATTELIAAGEETEGMAESTAKLREFVQGMTGFDIMKNAKEFKSTYDIIMGIGKVWKDLEDIEQAALLEKLAGKNRGNALAAALNNIEEIERAYKLAEESAGSATAEYDVYTQSVEAHAKQMEASMQSFSKSVLSKDIIIAGYDMGSGVLDTLTGIADVLGSIPTLATAAATAVTLFTGKGRSIVIYAPLRENPLAA